MEEVKKLAAAYFDPFSPEAAGAAQCGGFADPSQKIKQIVRFEGQLNSAGFGQIVFNPTCWNDVDCIWYSNAAGWGLSNMSQPTVSGAYPYTYTYGTGIGAAGFPGLPFAINEGLESDTENASVYGRIVSAGLKVKFTGATLTDGGVVYSLVEPHHNQLGSIIDAETLGTYENCKVQEVHARGDIELNLAPVCQMHEDFTLVAESRCNTAYGVNTHKGSGSNPLVVTGTTSYDQRPGLASLFEIDEFARVAYPLSNGDNYVRVVEDIYTAVTITSGVAAFGGTAAPPAGSYIFADITTGASYIIYYNASSSWRVYSTAGIFLSGLSVASSSYTLLTRVIVPSQYAVLLFSCGAAMANQPFHVEGVVHCEYIGRKVQGRLTYGVSLPREVGVLKTAIANSKRAYGSQAHTKLKHHAEEETVKALKDYAPSVVEAVVESAFGSDLGKLAGRLTRGGVKRLKHL